MRIVLFFCFATILLVACTKDKGDTNTNNWPGTFPGKVGDIWVYQVADTQYTLQAIDAIRTYDMIVSVIGTTMLPGNIKANIWIYNSPIGIDTNYAFQNKDTINFAVSNGSYFDVVRRYVIPLQLHNSWEYSSNSVNNVTIDSQANISVGSNRFNNAFRLFGYPGRPDQIVNVEEWIKDSVGIVKRYLNTSTTNDPSKHHTSWSILNYSIK